MHRSAVAAISGPVTGTCGLRSRVVIPLTATSMMTGPEVTAAVSRVTMSAVTRAAFVTGASRGIGQSCAVALANAGFDVALSARTVETGEEREHSPTLRRSDTSALPGSLQETAAAVKAAGRRALVVPADLLDRASLEAAATSTLGVFGRVDVV